MTEFLFAFDITGPILLLLLIGWAVRKIGWVDSDFVGQANKLVFNVAMPAMLFLAVSSKSSSETLDLPLAMVGLGGTLLLVGLLLIVGRVVPEDQRGVFVQGSYRGNLAVLGVALAVATFGSDILPLIAVYLAVVTTAYNVLAVWVLNSNGLARQLIKNPILLGILAGGIVSVIGLPIPDVIRSTGNYLSAMTLPLALICIGATLDFGSLRSHGRSISLAVVFKLIVSPLLLMALGVLFGLDNHQLGVLFFMAASPTATASYIMARQMTQHGALAAEIVAVTTALGVVSYTVGIALMKGAGIL